jgi:hypothetical protein
MARDNRGEYLKVYEVRIDKGKSVFEAQDHYRLTIGKKLLHWLRLDGHCVKRRRQSDYLLEMLHGLMKDLNWRLCSECYLT